MISWRLPGGLVDLQEACPIGILNTTPDSFSDGGRHDRPEAALRQAWRLLEGGARLLDLGAESTRPGARSLDPSEEWDRLGPVLHALRRDLPEVPLSVDTRHAETAARALDAGAAVLNDISGFRDPVMLLLARRSGCGLIAMRSRWKGSALWMPQYDAPAPANTGPAVAELAELRDRLLAVGIAPERIVLDPGFGFGTTALEDAALWEALPTLPQRLEWPVERFCIGISRKRFVAWHSGMPDSPPEARDEATWALHREAATHGYRIFRTHALQR